MPRGVRGTAKHGGSMYSNGCRCDLCREGHRRIHKSQHETRLATRVLINGEWVATKAKTHGTISTYSNWGCHCPPCAEAGKAQSRKRYREKKT